MRIGLKFNFRMIKQCKESERESEKVIKGLKFALKTMMSTKWKESGMP